jgi:hypothetical protein
MKVIRVPWIVCRADEFGASNHVVMWRGQELEIMAYSEKEARDWWDELSDSERSTALNGGGGAAASPDDGFSLF